MHCPICIKETKVVDSRNHNNGTAVRRRRECTDCKFRFSTLEEIQILDLIVVKRDGSSQPYRREKLEQGLRTALQKRSFTSQAYQDLIRSIELEIQSLKSQEVLTRQIGKIVMDKLKMFDKVAYIRFASVYFQFDDLSSFDKVLQELLKEEK